MPVKEKAEFEIPRGKPGNQGKGPDHRGEG